MINADRNLAEAGTDKSRVLTVMVYVADIRGKPEFNRAWDEWVDHEHLPMRACLGDLGGAAVARSATGG